MGAGDAPGRAGRDGAVPGRLIGVSLSSTGPLLPLFERRLGSGTVSASLLVTAYFTGSLAAMLLVAASRRPGRALLPWGIGLYAAGSLGVFAAHWLPALAAALIGGFGSGTVVLIVNSAFARQPSGVAPTNLLNGCFAVGTVAGPLVAEPSLALGRPYGFLLAALGAVLCLRVRAVADWPARCRLRRSESPRDGSAIWRKHKTGAPVMRSLVTFDH
ncbi:fucose permease [Streptomyces sp. B3I7]|nr:fucose permease [Streptomyces sp. B3I7]